MKSPFSDSQLNFLVAVNVLVVAAAAALTGADFLDPYNLQSIASQLPELGLLAMGVMLAMIAGNGGIDLSGIALANLAAIVASVVSPLIAAPDTAPGLYALSFCALALATGVLGGAMNGVLIAAAGLTPILCTLGSQLLFTGIAVVITHGSGVRVSSAGVLETLGSGAIAGLPGGFALFMALALALGAGLRWTASGRQLFLLGSNAKAARFAGIPAARLTALVYTLSGLLSGVAGIVIASRTLSAKWDYGSSYVLIAILIAVMAGVRPEGGYGRVVCLLLSTAALQVLSSTFNFLNITNFFRDCAWGLLLLLFLGSSRIDFRAWRGTLRRPSRRTEAGARLTRHT